MKLCVAVARHNFKWLKLLIYYLRPPRVNQDKMMWTFWLLGRWPRGLMMAPAMYPILLEHRVLKGSYPCSNIEKGCTYMPGMYVEPLSILLYGKEHSRTLCSKSIYMAALAEGYQWSMAYFVFINDLWRILYLSMICGVFCIYQWSVAYFVFINDLWRILYLSVHSRYLPT